MVSNTQRQIGMKRYISAHNVNCFLRIITIIIATIISAIKKIRRENCVMRFRAICFGVDLLVSFEILQKPG